MGGGTFFKVGGGTTARQKDYQKFLWFEFAPVTSQALKYDVIAHTPYEGLNYANLNKIAPLWKRIGEPPEIQIGCYWATQVNNVTRVHPTIYSDWIKPFDASTTEIHICFHSG